ncbi:MAG: glycosyltransferase family 4 protein [Chloroflexi bacterium]|nr:glycosyltransferase family 4 protein [Chloroflexota bacterium]
MKVLVVSKILLVAAYRQKLDAIAAQPGVDRLVALTTPEWHERGGRTLRFERSDTHSAYDLRVEPIWLNGSYHLFFWPTLGRVMREVRPDVVHLDEEPYNLATAHGSLMAQRTGARSLFFSWQNLLRRYPPPFSWFERGVYQRSAFALAGSSEALSVLHAKGYCGPASVVPQFGVDPELFAPGDSVRCDPPVIGFIGRLVEEKGVFVLLDALANLGGDWRLHVIGSGPLEPFARQRAEQLAFSERVTWERGVRSTEIPGRLRGFTVLVQPSLTRRHWKEQFGRAVMEAMACGVPVVGSDSGEIPNVIGDAGIVVREDDRPALRDALRRILNDAELRDELSRRGRERVLRRFTHARIAEATVTAYQTALYNSAT